MSAGWGRNWYKTDKASFFADIGPGFKRDVTKATDTIPSETNTSLIVQAQALYLRKINDFVEFKQTLSAKMSTKSGDNSTYKAESSITTKLIKTLQLKFTVAFDYNSKVDIDKENLDTQTSVTLVYSF
jgi:putative salt-induced outer membrane protein YdiY